MRTLQGREVRRTLQEREVRMLHLRCSYFHTPSSWVSGAVRIVSTS